MEDDGAEQGRPLPLGGYPVRAIWLLTVFSMVIMLGTLALGAIVLLDARTDAWQQAEQSSSNLALALEREIARTISVYDLSLQGAEDALKLEDYAQLSPQTRQMTLFDRAASAEYLGSMLVLDQQGWIVADSTALVPHRLYLGDRDYFTIHQQRPDAGVFLSRPFRSRLRGGDASIAISRRLSNADGSFAGVVSGTMRLAYFQELFASLDLGPGSSVLLVRTDGILVARHPVREGDVGRDMGGSVNVRRFLAVRSGSIVGVSALDGIDRLYSFRRIGAFPLVLGVAVSVEQVYAAWWRKALGIGSILLVLCLAAATLGLLFRREMLRRAAAEEALRSSAEQLRVIATTDVMTGLPNRRAFEAALDLEWRRARRAEGPVALLMLDADWFKPYNDTYGHLAGDRVLQALADCLRRNVGRPGDMCARHGGEEFVVLLPDTGMRAGAAVADRILRDVASLQMPHDGSPLGRVSVSIGVAAMHPHENESDDLLVIRADEALYEAKRAGRDRVVAGAASPQTASLSKADPDAKTA